MSDDNGVDVVLGSLPDGMRAVSTLLTGPGEARHVYRVVGLDGTVVEECSTLIEFIDVVCRCADGSRADADLGGGSASTSG